MRRRYTIFIDDYIFLLFSSHMTLIMMIAISLSFFDVFFKQQALADELSSYALVNEDATLRIERKTVHLYGIHIPKTSTNCRTRQQPPVCGQRAVLALEFKIKSFVRCEVIDENEDGSITGRCRVNYSHFDPGEDLSAYLLERGWAVALPDAPIEYKTLERIAESRRIGIWGIAIDRPYISPFQSHTN